MSWCPKCRTEYQEGIEKCADCGSELVDELPQEEEITEEQMNPGDQFEEDFAGEARDAEAVDGEESAFTEEEAEEALEEARRRSEPAKVYVSKSDESRDMVQTAVTFLVFAVLLITLFVLGALNVIEWFSSIPSLIVLAAMSLGCCFVGINAAFRARKAQSRIGEEEQIKNRVSEWLDANFVKEDIEERFASVEPEEARYIKEVEYVKDELMKEIEGLDEALADTMVEEYFDEHMV